MDKKIIFALVIPVFILLASPAFAVRVREQCINSTAVRMTFDFSLTSSGNATSYDYFQEHECSSGCSYTLNTCRFDTYTEALYAFGLIGGVLVFCTIALFISDKTGTGIYIALLMIATVLSIVIALTDVFSAMYRTIFLGFAFLPSMLILFSYWRDKGERKESLEVE